jgi:hypothetical protein
MSFQAAVASTPQIINCYRSGLHALAPQHRALISVRDTRGLTGSVDLDTCLSQTRPNENRWDYCFAYKNEAFFVEVHPAGNMNDVETVIRKLNWLRAWLVEHAPEIYALKATSRDPFHWLHTGYSQIVKGSRQYNLAAQNGIRPKACLEIKH